MNVYMVLQYGYYFGLSSIFNELNKNKSNGSDLVFIDKNKWKHVDQNSEKNEKINNLKEYYVNKLILCLKDVSNEENKSIVEKEVKEITNSYPLTMDSIKLIYSNIFNILEVEKLIKYSLEEEADIEFVFGLVENIENFKDENLPIDLLKFVLAKNLDEEKRNEYVKVIYQRFNPLIINDKFFNETMLEYINSSFEENKLEFILTILLNQNNISQSNKYSFFSFFFNLPIEHTKLVKITKKMINNKLHEPPKPPVAEIENPLATIMGSAAIPYKEKKELLDLFLERKLPFPLNLTGKLSPLEQVPRCYNTLNSEQMILLADKLIAAGADVNKQNGIPLSLIGMRTSKEVSEYFAAKENFDIKEVKDRLILANKFSIGGSFEYNGINYNNDGFVIEAARENIMESFSLFFKDREDLNTTDLKQAFELDLQDKREPDVILADLEAGKPIYLNSGWGTEGIAHATCLILFKKEGKYFLFKGNKIQQIEQVMGSKDARISNISNNCLELFEIKRPSHLMLAYLKEVISKNRRVTHNNEAGLHLYFTKYINEELNLVKQDFIWPMHEQKSGNCTFAAAKLALRALLYLNYSENLEREQALEKAKITFKEWRDADRRDSVKNYIEAHMKEGELDEKIDKYLLNQIVNVTKDAAIIKIINDALKSS